MPFVTIALNRGKPRAYIQGVSDAVHQALVEGLGMFPEDRFQVINQYEPGDLVYHPTFRGTGTRSEDFIVFTIIDGVSRGDAARRKFYQRLAEVLEQGPGVRPEDVLVMIVQTPPSNFSFASGIAMDDTIAAESLARLVSGASRAYTTAEMTGALLEFFQNQNRGPLVSMLRDEFTLKVPASLPYGGTYTGPAEIDKFLASMNQGDHWESFVTNVDHVITAEDHLVVPITINATGKTSGKSMTAENLWLIEISRGNFVRAQIYADTAAGRGAVG